jgi:hypothetical protein
VVDRFKIKTSVVVELEYLWSFIWWCGPWGLKHVLPHLDAGFCGYLSRRVDTVFVVPLDRFELCEV